MKININKIKESVQKSIVSWNIKSKLTERNISVILFLLSLLIIVLIFIRPEAKFPDGIGFIDNFQPCKKEIDILITDLESNFPMNLTVKYGSTKSYGEVYIDKEFKTKHEIYLKNLLSGTTYFLEINSCKKEENSCVTPNNTNCIVLEDSIKTEKNIAEKVDYIAYFQPKNINFEFKNLNNLFVTIDGELIEKINMDKEVNLELLEIILSNDILKESNLKYEGYIEVDGIKKSLKIKPIYGTDKWNYHSLKLIFNSELNNKRKQIKISLKIEGKVTSVGKEFLFPFNYHNTILGLKFISKSEYEQTKYCNVQTPPCKFLNLEEQQTFVNCDFGEGRKATTSGVVCGEDYAPIRLPFLPKSNPNFNLKIMDDYYIGLVKPLGKFYNEIKYNNEYDATLEPEENNNLFTLYFNINQPKITIYLMIFPIIFLYFLCFLIYSNLNNSIINKIKHILDKTKFVPLSVIFGVWFYWQNKFNYSSIISLFSLFYLFNLIAIILIFPSNKEIQK